jgi:hypothetical protein
LDQSPRAAQVLTALRAQHLTQPAELTAAYAATVRAQGAILTILNTEIKAMQRAGRGAP